MEQGILVALCQILKIITMKINLTTLLYYYHKFIYGLIYFTMRYFNENNVFTVIGVLSVLLSSTVFTISILNSWDIMSNPGIVQSMEQFDVPIEIIQRGEDKGDKTLNECNKLILKFLNLFNTNNTFTVSAFPEELKNHFYIQGGSSKNWDVISARETYYCFSGGDEMEIMNYDKYLYKSSYHAHKAGLYVETLYHILNDLKSINDNLYSYTNNM
uniref:Uncharacterized protein n=1 Tax=Fusarium begoniae TaxID=48487 RepID=A0A6M4B024_9HYPO|nr:hypothetical protein [Fusarium begoniae]